jgi:hypothetical protein
MTITGFALFILLILLPEILALALLFLLVRFFFSPARTSPCLWVCGTQVALCGFLLVTSWRTSPGPFISVSTDIFPAIGSLAMLAVVVRMFRRSPAVERIGLSLVALASIAVLALVISDVEPFRLGPLAHGRLVGW